MNPELPEGTRSPALTGKLLEPIVGERVEVVARAIWPTPELPDLVERWIVRYEPDVVLLKVNWYWYGYESVPLRLNRILGPLGRPLAALGLRAAATRHVGTTRVFKLVRRGMHRVIGGDSPFTSKEVIERVEACIRRLTAREGIVVVVKGTATHYLDGEVMVADYPARFAKKRDLVEGTLARFCRQVHVSWADNRQTGGREHEGLDSGDGLHKAASAQAFMAGLHAASIAEAMRAAGVEIRNEAPAAG